MYGGTRCRGWLRRCATSRKTVEPSPDGVIDFFNYLILSTALGFGLYSVFSRNVCKKQEIFLGSRAWRARVDDKLSTISELPV
jgi:hypothetical protein